MIEDMIAAGGAFQQREYTYVYTHSLTRTYAYICIHMCRFEKGLVALETHSIQENIHRYTPTHTHAHVCI